MHFKLKITAGQQISLLDVGKSHCFSWGEKKSVNLPLFHSGSIHFVCVASFHAVSKEFASDWSLSTREVYSIHSLFHWTIHCRWWFLVVEAHTVVMVILHAQLVVCGSTSLMVPSPCSFVAVECNVVVKSCFSKKLGSKLHILHKVLLPETVNNKCQDWWSILLLVSSELEWTWAFQLEKK